MTDHKLAHHWKTVKFNSCKIEDYLLMITVELAKIMTSMMISSEESE
jgi:hypothetical protein